MRKYFYIVKDRNLGKDNSQTARPKQLTMLVIQLSHSNHYEIRIKNKQTIYFCIEYIIERTVKKV